jgi:light-regulated signal transduction histidine kinase (bacteriophytochrome)
VIIVNAHMILFIKLKKRGNEIFYIMSSLKVDETVSDWCFTFKDSFIGISKNYDERIFKIFKRLHTNVEFKGTGIGLAICKRIAEIHNVLSLLTPKKTKGHPSILKFLRV